MRKIREDSKGLFVTCDGHLARPTLPSCFNKGDQVYANHHEGSELYTVKNKLFEELWRGTELSNEVKNVLARRKKK